MTENSDFILYVQIGPHRFKAYDHKGHVCGFVDRESMENDIAYRDRHGMPYRIEGA